MRISDWSSDVCSSDLLSRLCGSLCLLAPDLILWLCDHGRGRADLLREHPLLAGRRQARRRQSVGRRRDDARMDTVEPAAVPSVQRTAAYRLIKPRSLPRSEEHTSELQSLMRISYAVFCLKKHTILFIHAPDGPF